MEVLVTPGSHVIVGLGGPLRRGETAEVRDVVKDVDGGTPDRLLVRWGGGEGVVVDMVPSLLDLPENAEPPAPTRPKIGDRVLVEVSAKLAFEKLAVHETRELELTRDPTGSYEDIAGLDDKIDIIKEAIELPYLQRSLFEVYHLERPRGILLYGPPGCGKTMIGRAVANGLKARITEQLDGLIARLQMIEGLPSAEAQREYEALSREAPREVPLDLADIKATIERLESAKSSIRSYFLNVKGPELLSKWVGEAEHRIRQVFAEAKREASYTRPVVVFFDEIESMFQRRGSGISSDMEKTLVPQLLAELDGVERLENVIVIGASNRPELLDPALLRPGRLDVKIKIDRPDRASATAIFYQYLRDPTVPLSSDALGQDPRKMFDRHVAKVVSWLSENGCYLGVGGANGGPCLLPLRDAIPDDMVADLARQLGRLGAPVGGGGRRRRFLCSDIADVIQQVCRQHIGRLVAERRLPQGAADVTVLFPLGDVERAFEQTGMSGVLSRGGLGNGSSAEPGDRDQLLHALIEVAVDALFSPQNFVRARVLSFCDAEHLFPLREFVSGALIHNVISRAKRLALKREAQAQSAGPRGITSGDVLAGIREEYEENKDQFIANKPEITQALCDACKRRHNSADEYDIDVILGHGSRQRWHSARRYPGERSEVDFGHQAGVRS